MKYKAKQSDLLNSALNLHWFDCLLLCILPDIYIHS